MSLIDTQITLSNTQKLHYLRSALSGEAAEILNSIDLTEDNYALAWELLNQNYGSKRFIVWRHGELLLDTSPIEKNSASSIRRFANNIRQHLKALQTLNQPVDQWDTIVIIMLLPKLDRDTRMEFERKLESPDIIPTLDTFLNFLLDKARYLESGERNLRQGVNTKNKPEVSTTNKFSTKRIQTFNASAITCPLCNDNTHRVYECEQLTNKSPPEREKYILEAHLCSNCLRKGHAASQCKSISCRICDGRHHTLLHAEQTQPAQEKQ